MGKDTGNGSDAEPGKDLEDPVWVEEDSLQLQMEVLLLMSPSTGLWEGMDWIPWFNAWPRWRSLLRNKAVPRFKGMPELLSSPELLLSLLL